MASKKREELDNNIHRINYLDSNVNNNTEINQIIDRKNQFQNNNSNNNLGHGIGSIRLTSLSYSSRRYRYKKDGTKSNDVSPQRGRPVLTTKSDMDLSTDKNKNNTAHFDKIEKKILGQTKMSGVESRHKSMMSQEPTYRLEPSEGQKFDATMARKLLELVLKNVLHDYKYDKNASNLTLYLTSYIMKKVTSFFVPRFPRYKFVCHVTMINVANQGVRVADRCLKNAATDNFASATYTGCYDSGFACIASLFGFYND